jgi:excisionase family DNA binding protein
MVHFVTVKELGQYLKLSEATLYKLAASGKIPGFKIGDSWRFDMGEVQKLIKKGRRTINIKNRVSHIRKRRLLPNINFYFFFPATMASLAALANLIFTTILAGFSIS